MAKSLPRKVKVGFRVAMSSQPFLSTQFFFSIRIDFKVLIDRWAVRSELSVLASCPSWARRCSLDHWLEDMLSTSTSRFLNNRMLSTSLNWLRSAVGWNTWLDIAGLEISHPDFGQSQFNLVCMDHLWYCWGACAAVAATFLMSKDVQGPVAA